MTDIEPQLSEAELAKRRRSRLSFVVLVAIAVMPLLAAYGMYFFFPDWAPATRSNLGTLIEPPVQVGEVTDDIAIFEGYWTLVVPAASSRCDDPCRDALYVARQVNVALGKDSSRVQRVMLQGEAQLDEDFTALLATEYPRMNRRVISLEAVNRLRELVSAGSLDGHVFVADPNGNLMLYFAPGQEGGDMIDDLKHLLRLSNIG